MAKWIIALFAFVSPAQADTYLNIYGYAYHPADSRHCSPGKSVCRDRLNEKNYGLGVRHTLNHVDVGAGAFKDSFDDWSYYAGVEKQWHIFGPVYGGGQAFVSSRKSVNDYSPFLGAVPVVSVRAGCLSLNMNYVPKYRSWKLSEVYFFYVAVRVE